MNPSLPDSMIKDIDKMKGDAIGDTLYSERWVLKTLMKLSKEYSNYCNPDDYHLETSLEEDLSVLWDMTIEPAVAEFLMENNVVELITDVITVSCSPRMNEIMVGILGNLACQEQVRQKIGENEDLIKIIINQLTSSDSPTLIQVMRLINTCIWNLSDKNSKQSNSSDPDNEENESCWISTLKTEKELLQQSTCFILASSRNEELLKSTLSLIDSLFNVTDSKDDFFCKTFSTETFVQALVEAVKEMTKGAEDGNKSMYNKEMLKHGLAHWISLLHRLTSHNIGVRVLENQSVEVFTIVNSVWVEKSTRCDYLGRSHVRDLMLALEIMTLLLPFQQQCHSLKCALNLLHLTANRDFVEEEEKREDLKEVLEEFCFLVMKQWKLKSHCIISELECYSNEEIDTLSKLLRQKLSETSTSSSESADEKLKELESLVDSISL